MNESNLAEEVLLENFIEILTIIFVLNRTLKYSF